MVYIVFAVSSTSLGRLVVEMQSKGGPCLKADFFICGGLASDCWVINLLLFMESIIGTWFILI